MLLFYSINPSSLRTSERHPSSADHSPSFGLGEQASSPCLAARSPSAQGWPAGGAPHLWEPGLATSRRGSWLFWNMREGLPRRWYSNRIQNNDNGFHTALQGIRLKFYFLLQFSLQPW